MLKDLTYKVIVIDDEVDLYEDYIEIIENRLTEEGYILKHDRYEELSDLDENPIFDVDLFLVDLKFGKDDKGPEFIKKIRENYLTDILFYSSDSSAIQNNRISGEYQGVFFAIRDENKNEIKIMLEQLINKMIKRSNTPLSSRGIVLGCVAELDNIIKDKVHQLSEQLSVEQKKELINSCAKIYFESYKGQSTKVGNFFGCEFHKGMKGWKDVKEELSYDSLSNLVNNLSITDSYKNVGVLRSIYKKINGKNELYTTIASYSDLLADRNIFAHVQEELKDGLYQFKRLNDDEYLVLTDEMCRSLRSKIIMYYQNISKI